MNKPTECIICLEELKEKYALPCGHWLHMSCVQKHFKPECPICRSPLDIQVSGIHPSNSSFSNSESFDHTTFSPTFVPPFVNPSSNLLNEREARDFLSTIMPNFFQRSTTSFSTNSTIIEIETKTTPTSRVFTSTYSISHNNDDDDREDWKDKGYLYPEEDDDYDEENPRGDNWYYDDEDDS